MNRFRDWMAWLIYHRAARACRRLCERGSAGFVYVLGLRISDLMREFPMDEKTRSAAETYWRTQRDEKNKRGVK